MWGFFVVVFFLLLSRFLLLLPLLHFGRSVGRSCWACSLDRRSIRICARNTTFATVISFRYLKMKLSIEWEKEQPAAVRIKPSCINVIWEWEKQMANIQFQFINTMMSIFLPFSLQILQHLDISKWKSRDHSLLFNFSSKLTLPFD